METNPINEFKALFGVPPGTQDAQTDCMSWQRLCAKLLEERQRLREQLAKAEEDYLKSLFETTCKEFELNKEQILAQASGEPTLKQIITELEQRLEKKA